MTSTLRRLKIWFALPLTAVSGFAATVEPAGDRTEVEIRRLGDDRYAIREDAMTRLWKLGRPALPQLRAAAANADPEIAKRSRILIRKIELEITPDTAPEVLALVEKYQQATQDQKAGILGELRNHSAWKQLLRLFRDEKDPVVRNRIRPAIDATAIEAAREQLVAGKPEEARELLELAPEDGASVMALAELHRSRGTLAAELAKTTRPGRKLALLRASGDLARTRAEASAMGDHRIVALMALLEGDPTPWFATLEALPNLDPAPRAYIQLARKQWGGESLAARDLTPLTDLLKADGDSERSVARGLLFLLGQTGAAEPSLAQNDPRAAFKYFDQLERVSEALRVAGLDPAKPDYKSWLAKRFEALIRQPDDADDERDELLMMANFLERRGLTAELAAYDEPLAKFSEAAPDAFSEFLASLFERGIQGPRAPDLGRRIAVNYAKDDDGKWTEVLHAAFGEDRVSEWWDWFGQLDPQASRAERFDALLALFRVNGDPPHLRAVWLKKIWTAVGKLPKADAGPKLSLLKELAFTAGDLETGLRAWNEVQGEDQVGEEDPGNGNLLLFLSAAGRWDRAAELWVELTSHQPERAEFHAYAASSLRRAGKLKEAAEQDLWVEKLALGEMTTLGRIAQGYAYGRDFQRASEWLERAVREASPDNGNWNELLQTYATDRLDARDWKRAAAAGEVLALAHATAGDQEQPEAGLLRLRVSADFPRALVSLGAEPDRSIKVLEHCHRLLAGDGSLADSFFPALRSVGLKKEHDAWFERTWTMLQPVLSAYPDGANTSNTAAWLASRAVCHLDEAGTLIERALARSPEESAYLDTCGELWFARGDRKKALEWSSRAIANDPLDGTLRRQNERFRNNPLP